MKHLLRSRDSDELELGGPHPERARGGALSLVSRQVEAMVEAWRRGERPTAAQFLDEHPELDEEAAIRLIYEEVCLRQEASLEIDPGEFLLRYPRWKAQLEVLLDCHRMLKTSPPPVIFPEVGSVLGGFRLLAELGRGASGRIFLSSQPSLADRPVVLKVIHSGQDEHLCLARLQHMNIVPLYSEQVLSTRGLRILCMPYLGGATLAQILRLLREVPPIRRTGKHVVDALDQVQSSLPIVLPAQGPFRKHLARVSYVQAICWIGACLADGLQYAHDRGLVHMDIKPSNMLLTGDGQPMLLDFHLARGPVGPEGPPPRRLGGTPEYLSPEQRAAMAAIRAGRTVPTAVDGRSDLYSLGVFLDEALGGAGPEPQGMPLHRLNPQVSVGLSDVIQKCLRADPRERYADAAALAADLRRHLNHLPLQGVPNRSPLERWRKWRRRNPAALPRNLFLLLTAATVLAAAALLSTAYRQRVAAIETALGNSRQAIEHHQYAEAAAVLKRGLALATATPAVSRLREDLEEELRLVQHNAKAAELHRLAELVRFRYGLAPQPSEEAHALLDRGRRIWEARGLLVGPAVARRNLEVEQTIRTDLLDFVTIWADLRVRLAPEFEVVAARREALQWLEEATVLLGPSPALERLRQSNAEALGRPITSGPGATAPESAWDHCDLGRSELRSGRLAEAAAHFQRAVELRPQDFWPNFYQGLCAFQQARFTDAIAAFRVCVALAPESAECYFNRALALEAAGEQRAALRDYSRALELDRGLTAAALNRGILLLAEGRPTEAAADLDHALATAASRETRGSIHYNRALVDLARGDRPAALADLDAALRAGHEQARNLRKKLEH